MIDADSIPHLRVSSQHISPPLSNQPLVVVNAMGAVQAQDYLGSLWAIGVRTRAATEAGVEQTLAAGSIVRSWPLRGTLHIVAAADLRWMLELLTPRMLIARTGRYAELELDEETFSKCRKLMRQILKGGNRLTREAVLRQLEAAHLASPGPRANNILRRLGQDGWICFGPRQGKQPTFVLLDEWVPDGKSMEREAALAELTRRYFTSRGPATAADYSWWSGLSLSDARAGLELAKEHLVQEVVDGETYWRGNAFALPHNLTPSIHLLPAFDEYLIAYRDRRRVLDPIHIKRTNAGGGMLSPVILSDGQVVGTWKRTLKIEAVIVKPDWFAGPTPAQQAGFAAAAERYGAFLGLTAILD